MYEHRDIASETEPPDWVVSSLAVLIFSALTFVIGLVVGLAVGVWIA